MKSWVSEFFQAGPQALAAACIVGKHLVMFGGTYAQGIVRCISDKVRACLLPTQIFGPLRCGAA